jgi:hypothetical protein
VWWNRWAYGAELDETVLSICITMVKQWRDPKYWVVLERLRAEERKMEFNCRCGAPFYSAKASGRKWFHCPHAVGQAKFVSGKSVTATRLPCSFQLGACHMHVRGFWIESDEVH